MGQVIILHNNADLLDREVIEFEGPFIDFMEQRFPEGFEHLPQQPLIVDATRGEAMPCGEEWFEPINNRVIGIGLNRSPKGYFAGWIVYLIITVVSIAVSYLLQPDIPGRVDQEQAASVYSVSTKANKAKIGGVIPVQYGQYTRTPEYASQSYRIFEDDQEIRYFLLCLGCGDYQIDQIRLGDTPITDLPAGLIEYTLYNADDHTKTLGVIDADFGMHENVSTSGEVDALEIEYNSRPASRSMAQTTSGSSVLDLVSSTGPWLPAENIAPGDSVQISGETDNSIDGTYTVSDLVVIDNPFGTSYVSSITIEETFPAALLQSVIEVNPVSAQDNSRGPFVVNKSGTTVDKIQIDVEHPRGLYVQEDNGSFSTLKVEMRAIVQEIDDDGNDIGLFESFTFSQEAASDEHIRKTIDIVPSTAPGRYKIKVERTDQAGRRARDAQQTNWTGLKGFLTYDTASEVYGETAILAVKITGAQEVSRSSQQRIWVKSTRKINQLDTTTQIANGNLADVFADIIIDQSYGARGTTAEYDSASLQSFRTSQLSRSGFNGVFDTPITVWEALSNVALLGRARPYPRGLAMSVVVDEVKPTMSSTITPDNILPDSFKGQYNWIEPGANDGVQVEYRDVDTGDPLYVTFPEGSLDAERKQTIGLIDEDEALSMAKYVWRQKTLRNLQLEWSMELDGNNFTPYERVGVIMPAFDWGKSAHVLDSNGTSVTLSNVAPSGELSIIFRDEYGEASAIVSATGDGSDTIVLDAAPPITLVSDGSQAPTLCAFDLTDNFAIQEASIVKINRRDKSTQVSAVNYTTELFTGLV